MNYLVLGDGNFTFSLSLCKQVLGPDSENAGSQIVTSSLESKERVLERPHVKGALKQLREWDGVRVLHNLDATLLHCSETLKTLKLEFDVVIFNFPHTGRSKIHENRTLLKEFFISVARSALVSSGCGRVWVSLSRGQGGTPGDSSLRGYHDTWKVVEMAAEGGLVLDCVEPFLPVDYPDYVPTGYRGDSDKGFRLDGALRHIFRFPSPSCPSLHPPHYRHDISFWWAGTEGEFDVVILKDAVKRVCEGCVQGVECQETYRPHPPSERVGYCYRLTYGSTWDAVSHTRARDIQLLLRETMQEHTQVELR